MKRVLIRGKSHSYREIKTQFIKQALDLSIAAKESVSVHVLNLENWIIKLNCTAGLLYNTPQNRSGEKTWSTL